MTTKQGPGGRQRRFDPDEAVRRWRSGCYATIADIARSFGGVSASAVGLALNARGIFGSPGGQGCHSRKVVDGARIAELARAGWTRAEVGAAMGLSHPTVRKHWPADVKPKVRAAGDTCNERSPHEQAVIDRAATDRLLRALVAANVPPLASRSVWR